MKKYTEEQLSRILSASAAGILGSPSGRNNTCSGTACIEQAAQATYEYSFFKDGMNAGRGTIYDEWRYRMYHQEVDKIRVLRDPTLMLLWMETHGMA